MKKVIVIMFFLMVFMLLTTNQEYKIPSESIRFRIIANSNSVEDQMLKTKIQLDLLPIFSKIQNKSVSINETRKNIKENLSNIEEIVNNYTESYSISFGQNYFPKKTYQKAKYPAGLYESLVITVGSGIGDNWWCVLFPPLCLLEANKEKIDSIKYEYYFKEIIKRHL